MARKIKQRKHHIRRVAKVHGLVTTGFVLVYLLMGFFLGKNILISDLQNKYFAGFAVSATVRVWGPPSVPDITLTPVCSGGRSYILINWDADENATTFDVYRDGAELITGLITSSYQDSNVAASTDYEYYVIARGPEGEQTSSEENVETSDCSVPAPDPEIQVTRFENFDMTSYSNTPSTTDRRPEFSGTSNIANAFVRLEIHSSPIIIANTIANSNGYWSWMPASDLTYGLHTIYITLIDPLDAGRTDIDFFIFRIEEEDEYDGDDEEKSDDQENGEDPGGSSGSGEQEQIEISQTGQTGQIQEQESPGLFKQAPIDLSLRISEIDKIVVQGIDLSTQLYPGYTMTFEVTVASFRAKDSHQLPVFSYTILDPNGEEVYRATEERKVSEGEIFEKKITLPQDLKPGNYKLRIEANVGGYSVSEERWFTVEQSPIVALRSNFKSMLAGFFSEIGWLAIILILILVLLLVFAIVEWRIHHRDDSGMSKKLRNKTAH